MEKRASITPELPRSNPTKSYWQDQINITLPKPESQDLPNTADYVIIGSGISGACIAFNILERRRDAKIVMLEAREKPCNGATGRNGGHTKAASYRSFPSHAKTHGLEEAMKIARLEHANIVATHGFAQQHGIACESRPCETVDIVYDAETFQIGVAAIELMRRSLHDNEVAAVYDILSAEEVNDRLLTPGEEVVGGFKYQAGSINAYRFTMGVLRLCIERGMVLLTDTPVVSIEPSPAAATTQDLGKWTATTKQGQKITAATLVVATNGYTARLLPQLQGHVVPLRGQVTAQRSGSELTRLKPDGLTVTYSFIYREGFEYMVPRPKLADVPSSCVGDIVIGGGIGRLPDKGLSEYGETDDTVLNSKNSNYLRASLKAYFGENWGPPDDSNRVKMEWTGIMGATSDGLPFVGEVPDGPGLWVSAGFNGSGMVLCLKCAEALSSMIMGDDHNSIDWFPESFKISQERLNSGVFRGRAIGQLTKS